MHNTRPSRPQWLTRALASLAVIACLSTFSTNGQAQSYSSNTVIIYAGNQGYHRPPPPPPAPYPYYPAPYWQGSGVAAPYPPHVRPPMIQPPGVRPPYIHHQPDYWHPAQPQPHQWFRHDRRHRPANPRFRSNEFVPFPAPNRPPVNNNRNRR